MKILWFTKTSFVKKFSLSFFNPHNYFFIGHNEQRKLKVKIYKLSLYLRKIGPITLLTPHNLKSIHLNSIFNI